VLDDLKGGVDAGGFGAGVYKVIIHFMPNEIRYLLAK
jgi:hypothetical protein